MLSPDEFSLISRTVRSEQSAPTSAIGHCLRAFGYADRAADLQLFTGSGQSLMSDVFSSRERSRIMSLVRSRGNENTELLLARILRANAVKGWRRNYRLFGNPDFVFPDARLAVFVDGCFWHSCRRHRSVPSTNRDFWTKKLRRNRSRDRLVTRTLRLRGWRVLRIWQHELQRKYRRSLIRRLQNALLIDATTASRRVERRERRARCAC